MSSSVGCSPEAAAETATPSWIITKSSQDEDASSWSISETSDPATEITALSSSAAAGVVGTASRVAVAAAAAVAAAPAASSTISGAATTTAGGPKRLLKKVPAGATST